MAANSDGPRTTIVTCEGDLNDPKFPRRLGELLIGLETILGDGLNVCKLEPWNSVRVTLSVPRQAALRLRQLATDGQQQLRALGILSVQVEGDQVISLRLASAPNTSSSSTSAATASSSNSSNAAVAVASTSTSAATNSQEPQDIVLQTLPQDDGPSRSASQAVVASSANSGVGETVQEPGFKEKVQFRSPNVVCPTDTTVPKVPLVNHAPSGIATTTKTFSGPFPFTSMNQAITGRNEGPASGGYTAPPPPYPGKPPVTISSPLLVNLLQNEGAPGPVAKCETPVQPQNKFTPVVPGFMPQVVKKVVQAPPVGARMPLLTSNGGLTASATHLIAAQRGQIPNPALVPPNLVKTQLPKVENVPDVVRSDPQMPLGDPKPHAVPYRANTYVWESPAIAPLQDLTPSLTELKPDDLDSILPSLEHELTNSPAELLEELVSDKQSNPAPNNLNMHHPMNNQLNHQVQQLNQPQQILPSSNEVMNHKPAFSQNQNQLQQQQQQQQQVTSNISAPKTPISKSNDVSSNQPSSSSSHVNFLINPLTGELEPHSSSESEPEEVRDVFTGLPSPAAVTDDDTNSTIRPDTTDQSDSETRSSLGEPTKFRSFKSGKAREKGRDSPNLKGDKSKADKLKPTEKIKLRLKLEKSEPVNQAYKVDVSFINTQSQSAGITNKKLNTNMTNTTTNNSTNLSEELRVPPLHISLRGRNAVINNKKKKIEKSRKVMEEREKKDEKSSEVSTTNLDALNNRLSYSEGINSHSTNKNATEIKKSKKGKLQEYREQLESGLKRHHLDVYSMHHKDKHKERRGSDSELVKSKLYENCTISGGTSSSSSSDKKRRLSQCDDSGNFEMQPLVLGSTNTGTIPNHKIRKEKVKMKESFKSKDILVRNKNKNVDSGSKKLESLVKKAAEQSGNNNSNNNSKKSSELSSKKVSSSTSTLSSSSEVTKSSVGQIILPTGDVDMEAKIKQRLMEETKQTPFYNKPSGQVEVVVNNKMQVHLTKGEQESAKMQSQEFANSQEFSSNKTSQEFAKTQSHPQDHKLQDYKPMDYVNKPQDNTGLDELIETLSDVTTVKDKPPEADKCNTPDEKCNTPDTKSDISDVKTGRSPTSGAQGEDSGIESMDALSEKSPNQASQSPHNDGPVSDIKGKPQPADLLDIEAQLAKMEGFNASDHLKPHEDEDVPPHRNEDSKKCTTEAEARKELEADLEPLPLRIKPPLYTYSNPEKGRNSDSPTLSDSDSNQGPAKKSLLEQLLIEIPENQTPSSPSPATRSLRTRASSKLNSPELSSPVPKQPRLPTAKRKRHESEGSNHSLDDARNKKAKKDEGKPRKKVSDESSDSDEPLIEIAGKVRKSNQVPVPAPRTKVKQQPQHGPQPKPPPPSNNGNVSTRRSVRTIPALNTRSKGDKSNPESDILRRKTRSAVSEGEGRRKRDIK